MSQPTLPKNDAGEDTRKTPANARFNAAAARKPWTRPTLNLQALGIYIAAVVIFLIFGMLNPNFLTSGNLRDIAVSASVNAIIGLGITFVIITGGIDLAVGSIASFVGIVSATLMVNAGTSPFLALLAGIGLGLVCGAINGLLITKLKLPPFIATLGNDEHLPGLRIRGHQRPACLQRPQGLRLHAQQLRRRHPGRGHPRGGPCHHSAGCCSAGQSSGRMSSLPAAAKKRHGSPASASTE